MRTRFFGVSLVCSLIFWAEDSGAVDSARKAVMVSSSEVILDDQAIAQAPAGTEVEILGAKPESDQVLIRFHGENSREITGLVPRTAIVEVSAKPAGSTAPVTAPAPAVKFDPDRTVPAAELAKYLKTNRDKAKTMAGTRLNVTGVVDELRVTGSTGSGLMAEITLRTAPGLPKVRAYVHASEFFKGVDRRDQELRVQNNKILEGRSRSTNHDYRYYSYWYGVYRPVNKGRSSWLPIVSVDHPVKVSGIFSKYHISIELEAASLIKG